MEKPGEGTNIVDWLLESVGYDDVQAWSCDGEFLGFVDC